MNYSCGQCGADDCKLWRPASVFADAVELTCWECLEAKGHQIKLHDEYSSDQIYTPEIESTNYVPACPDLNGNWWGYTSVPQWWVEWWNTLPDKKSYCTLCRGTKKLEEFKCCFCDGTGERDYVRPEREV